MNVLIIPIFSMRSYETNQYAIMKDGNFQLSLARALASDFFKITLAIPENCSDEDVFDKFLYDALRGHNDRNISTLKLKYGMNAVETREQFWSLNEQFFNSEAIQQYDVIITDITGYNGSLPFINNFNITKLPELNRPYIDKFFEQDLESMRKALFTTVINPRQRDYIVEQDPTLAGKVFALTKVSNDITYVEFPKMPRSVTVDSVSIDSNTIFWPFRISDKAYQFYPFIEMFKNSFYFDEYTKIVVTDPNDTLSDEFLDNNEFIRKIKPTKQEYYNILAVSPIIVMLDDIDTVLHPGTIEFFNYRCEVITLESKLLPTSHHVSALEFVPKAIDDLSYEEYEVKFDLDDFVYRSDEVCELYNSHHILSRIVEEIKTNNYKPAHWVKLNLLKDVNSIFTI